eukprot:TRINITY_DN60652_c0_g1_i1.p1 TRINITY_DN60652_c0_g1~~TRINITY_DN60652_c0_g1_i1.p1  ORF type:complete len:753 (-),score=152.30 TRINITY_DN60652_c0_g1_i1:280-2538(-)
MASGEKKRRSRGGSVRQPYSEQQRASAPSEFLRKCMELADFDTNERGGALKWRGMHKAVVELAPPAKRAKLAEVSKNFKSNTVNTYRAPLDELINEILEDESASPQMAPAQHILDVDDLIKEEIPVSKPPAARTEAKKSKSQAPASAVAVCKSSGSSTSNSLMRFFKSAGMSSKNSINDNARAKTPVPPPSTAGRASSGSSRTSGSMRDPDPQGYYRVLKLSPDASGAEIRAAFVQQVLQVHPDKGGSAAEFNAVKQAFDVLADWEKRADYDGKETEEPETFSAHGSTTSNSAKTALATLLVSSPDAWPYQIASMASEVLDAAASLLQECTGATCQSEDTDNSDAISKHGNGEKDATSSGLSRLKSGDWMVKVGWRNFYIETGVPINSLERASHILAAATQIREVAKARHKAFLQCLSKNRCPAPGNAVDECPPLLQSELFRLICMEPCVWHFASDMQRKPRIMSPFTPSLQLSLEFRSLIRRVQDKAKECLFREDLDKNARAWMKQQAIQDRTNRTQSDQQLLECINKQLFERGQRRDVERPVANSLTNGPQTLAIQDAVTAAVTSVASELESMQRAALGAFSSSLQKESSDILKRCRETLKQQEENRVQEEALQAKLEESVRKHEEQHQRLEAVLKASEEQSCLQEAAEKRTAEAVLCARYEAEEKLSVVQKEKDELQNEILRLQKQVQLARTQAEISSRRPCAPVWAGGSHQQEMAQVRQAQNFKDITSAAAAKVMSPAERAWHKAKSM